MSVRSTRKADVIVVGGGAAGVAAAIASARQGAKTILIEKTGFLGGAATAAQVIPMMPNQAKGQNLTAGLYEEILAGLAQKYGASQRFSDNNPGWHHPELLKTYLEEVALSEGVQLFYDMAVMDTQVESGRIQALTCLFNGQHLRFEAPWYIDASGNADVAWLSGVPLLTDPGAQALSLRFMMGNVDLDRLAQWIQDVDPLMKNSALFKPQDSHWLLSTAHTLDSPDWVLRPWFEAGMAEGLITRDEAAYFQIFSAPAMPGVVSFNCPRIASSRPLDPLNPEDVSYAYTQGRQQIMRLVAFCQAKLPGFEHAFLSQIAPMLGVRVSRRIEGRYILTDEDILACRKFGDQAVARCAYPIDIHQASPNADKGGLQKLKDGDHYEIPLASLRPVNVDNLLVAGRCISASFVAQSSLRIQAVCWAMGQAAGEFAANTSCQLPVEG